MILATRTGPRSHQHQRIAHQDGRPRTSSETTPRTRRRASARICSNFGMKQLRVEREASYRGGVWSSPAAGPGRGREFRWDLRGPRSSPSPRGTGGGGGRGTTRESWVAPRDRCELGRAPEEAGSFIPPRIISPVVSQSLLAPSVGCCSGPVRCGRGRGGRPRVATLGMMGGLWTAGGWV
jgi:hypothetical protein